jgi:hypothetical protein
MTRLAIAAGLAVLAHAGCRPERTDPLPPGDYTARPADDRLRVPRSDREAVRLDALHRAKVWSAPAVPIPSADLGRNPDGGFAPADVVECRYQPSISHGRSPKFQCVAAGGEVLKVKYGRNNPETFGEVAATRLAAALGFAADRMYVVGKVRCHGCPPYPYPKAGLFDALRADPARVVDFDLAVIERRLPGREAGGWSWPELRTVEAAAGGATTAELDALRLLAVFLNNWDGKPVNQRLMCAESPADRCEHPVAYMQDLGQTFGPKSIDLAGWSGSKVWSDPASCAVSMKALPWHGSTFEDTTISEAGRLLLAGLLRQLSPAQVRALFVGARFTEFLRNDRADDVDAWTRAFLDRVAQIADRAPCPR